MSEDPWAAWQPTANPAARGNEVYQARRALSRDLSAGPMSPPRAKQSGSLYDRGAPSLPGPSTRASGRQPLPDQSFPARGGGPSRSGAGWQRSPPRGHLDHGWASRTGHEEPIAKPLIVGDIESATNAPLTEEQLRDVREKRSSRDDLHERASGRAVDSSRDVERYESSTRRRDRSRDGSSERHRGGLYERDRRKRPRLEDDDRERRTSRRRSRSRSRSRSRERRERESTRESIRDRDRRRHEERRDRHRDDRDGSRAHTSSSRTKRSDESEGRRRRAEADDKQPVREVTEPCSSSRNGQIETSDQRGTTTSTAPGTSIGPVNPSNNHAVLIENVAEGTTTKDIKTILQDYGPVTTCEKVEDHTVKQGTVSFQAGFATAESAAKVVSGLNGVLADGEYLHVTLLKDQEQDKPDASSASAESPELKLKGFASSNSKAGSLLSRLGAPVKPVTGLSNGKRRPNDVSLDYTKSLLHPYGNLLAKAGVDSVDTLRRLVRPGTVKEYIEMLCKEYPDEKLLEGLTARWALKERLEEWLGEKEALKMAWEQEEGPEVKLEEV